MEEVTPVINTCTKLNYGTMPDQVLMEMAAQDNSEALKELERRGAFKKPVKG
jgi:hypothetical protein